ncbi:MAG TPA: histidine kinase dimerization/phosphoacceptor domain -containing protein [Candidatus Methanoperedens sp.]
MIKPEELRRKAKEAIEGKATNLKNLSFEDAQYLVHELEVHQIELEMQNEELRRIQLELEGARNRYSDLYDFAPVGYFTFDKNGLILDVNLTGAQKLGIERSYLIKKPFSLYIEGNKDAFYSHIQEVLKSEKRVTFELRLLDKGGKVFDAQLENMPVRDINGNLLCRTAMSDITERKLASEIINNSLKEKEILLKEIHHRVKNNLQIVSSLITLQSDYIKDKAGQRAFLDSKNRIDTMALIHEKLYMSPDISRIDFADYVNEFMGNLFISYGVNVNMVKLKMDIENVSFDINTAIPVGLMVNELISNVLKHAFPEGKKGEIKIGLHPEQGGKFTLIVSDNGIGFPQDMDFKKTESLGMRLVNSLTNQLRGTIELDRTQGTSFKITFQEAKSKDIRLK